MNMLRKVKLFTNMVRTDFRLVFFQHHRMIAQGKRMKESLVLKGQISELEVQEDKQRQVITTTAKAAMELVNNNPDSMEVINPRYFEQSQVKYFATTKEDCLGRYTNLYSSPYPAKPPAKKEYSKLAEMLKADKSPEKIIIPLKQFEKTGWNETIHFEFDLVNKQRRWQGVGWNEFRRHAESFWFQFDYRLPEEMYFLKPQLMEILPENWRDAGEIPIARFKTEKIWGKQMLVETEPIFIDFSQAKSDKSKNNGGQKFV